MHPPCRRGESHPFAKLSEDKVREIRRRWPADNQKALADEFGVTQPCISSIVTYRTWAHIA